MAQTKRSYSELSKIATFRERFLYLVLSGSIGEITFGFDRYINQKFYSSLEWKRVRDEVIIRDNGCDLGISEFPIAGKVLVHHMNPILLSDVKDYSKILDPEYLICVSMDTHNAIHYGDIDYLQNIIRVDRFLGDTTLWPRRK